MMWRCDWRVALLLAMAWAAVAAAAPSGFVSTQRLAEELKLERQTLGMKDNQNPTMARLSSDKVKVTLMAELDFASVNGEVWRLSRPAVAEGGDLYVPADFGAKLAKSMGMGGPAPDKQASTTDEGVETGKRVVMLDPGHGGKDPGAIGRRGVREKDVVLDVGRRVARILEEKGVTVAMTRSTDVFIELDDRVEAANRRNPDLYVSIHADAEGSGSARGSTVYFADDEMGQDKADITYRAILHGRQSTVAPQAVGSPGGLSEPVEAVAYGIMLQEYRSRSWKAAQSILDGLGDLAGTSSRGSKTANYRVVRYPRCPSVLVELDYLSTPDVEQRLGSPSYRERLASGVATGILAYLKSQR